MFVWSKRLVGGLLGGFVLLIAIFLVQGEPESVSGLKIHTTRWMAANYIGLLIWVFVWMFDQARVRGKTYGCGWCPSRWRHSRRSCCSCCSCKKAEAVRGMKGSRIWFQIRRGMTGFPGSDLGSIRTPCRVEL